MYHTHTITADRLARYAAILGAYATTHEDFAHMLAGYLASLPKATTTCEVPNVSPYALPDTPETATQRLLWLMSQLAQKTQHETETARAILSAATRHIESPKALVIGIIGFAIPLIDLGLVKKKKKRQSMRIVIDEALLNDPKTNLVALTHEASAQLLAEELRAVFGNAHDLEPELAEWLFDDRAVRVYSMNQEALHELTTLLAEATLAHAAIAEGLTIQAVALSPSVHDDLALGEAHLT